MATLKNSIGAVGVVVALMAGGCSSGSGFLGLGEQTSSVTTGSLPEMAKADPACAGLSTQISTLCQEGVADKIEKAAAKKYKMTAADLTKADQLTKVSAEYQTKCSIGPKPTVAQAPTNIGTTGAQPVAAALAAAGEAKAAAATVKAAPKAAAAVVAPVQAAAAAVQPQ